MSADDIEQGEDPGIPPSEKRHPLLGVPINDEDRDWWSVGVREHSPEQRIVAARAILAEADPDCIAWRDHEEAVVSHLAGLLKAEFLRQHIVDNVYDDDDCGSWECGCEDVGWFCTEADGDPWPFFSATREQIDAASYTVTLTRPLCVDGELSLTESETRTGRLA